METELSERSVSVDILINFDENQRLDYNLADELETRERAQVREYVQNIMRKRSYLDFLIDEFSSVSVAEMKPGLKNILRLAIYDMLFMDSTPDYAAINEAVEIAKMKLGSKTGDLVNAIMRNLQRDREKLPKPAFKDRNKLVATTFSHPEWMVERWRKRFGEREAFQLMQANNSRPHYYVRVNTLRTKPENFELRLEKMDVDAKPSDWLPYYYQIDSVQPFISKGLLSKGICLVQDIAAGFAPTVLDPQPGEKVFDLCAAPGTKSIMMADLMQAEGEILSVDISSERLEKLAESALNYGAENIKIRRGDVLEVSLGLADAVLLDAPCTGTGVLSKRADLRWRRDEEGLKNAVELQEQLLEEAANMVKRGGRLVYSTCSLEPEENMEQITKFLEKYDNFELEPLEDYLPEEVLAEEGKAYQTFPHKHGCDGHFGVLLKRVK
ncbi:16S rRNA (cytosine(967)-C(5))-methyltransferase RsmB [Gracilimonas sediminicola]|uniref:16S rRNA (cytosine(967)-C(5))-methyltransferase n=1 Tax=Gracilimonas sediminicola TaxID=2952158 RepID=A0A9X2L5X3_9BACT|nr:16S rRNA (cytosine(967)-C(5))-methyltransferase RsmB [Gracilimonas sediminicola]MCP9292899.1 16S rRNA (cytosine(967)-C(5))-methyltransferase RsmB [Gracilimonas sediminicola]